MSPKQLPAIRDSHIALQRQRGFLIPLALFIVVVMALLALALTRMSTQTGLASAQELLSLQAFYAGESGAQQGMNQLYPPAGPNLRANVNARCDGVVRTLAFAGVTGLSGCSAAVSCNCVSCTPAAATSFYTITSVGSCNAGTLSATRTIRVGSFMDKDLE
jgi:MSHA biogenesis protein MshP